MKNLNLMTFDISIQLSGYKPIRFMFLKIWLNDIETT